MLESCHIIKIEMPGYIYANEDIKLQIIPELLKGLNIIC